MKTKYYQYSKTGNEKYSEFTEEEYLVARTDENRWFISFGSCVLECTEAEYRAYFSEKNHADYTQRDKNGKRLLKQKYSKANDIIQAADGLPAAIKILCNYYLKGKEHFENSDWIEVFFRLKNNSKKFS